MGVWRPGQTARPEIPARLAYTSVGPDAHHYFRCGAGTEMGRYRAGDPPGRCRLDSTGREALARSQSVSRHEPHCNR